MHLGNTPCDDSLVSIRTEDRPAGGGFLFVRYSSPWLRTAFLVSLPDPLFLPRLIVQLHHLVHAVRFDPECAAQIMPQRIHPNIWVNLDLQDFVHGTLCDEKGADYLNSQKCAAIKKWRDGRAVRRPPSSSAFQIGSTPVPATFPIIVPPKAALLERCRRPDAETVLRLPRHQKEHLLHL